MGLIQEEVDVNICTSNKSRYLKLGYLIPNKIKKGMCIKVKIKDLPIHSNVRIKVECDCCKKKYELTYDKYIKQNHNGNIYCHNCASGILNSGINNPLWNKNLTQEEREEKDIIQNT